jgi:hypothetical protein
VVGADRLTPLTYSGIRQAAAGRAVEDTAGHAARAPPWLIRTDASVIALSFFLLFTEEEERGATINSLGTVPGEGEGSELAHLLLATWIVAIDDDVVLCCVVL